MDKQSSESNISLYVEESTNLLRKMIDQQSVRFILLPLDNINIANFKLIRVKVKTCSQLWWTVPPQPPHTVLGFSSVAAKEATTRKRVPQQVIQSIPPQAGAVRTSVWAPPGLREQPAPARASPSPAAAGSSSACSAPTGPPATAAGGRSPLTSGCTGSW